MLLSPAIHVSIMFILLKLSGPSLFYCVSVGLIPGTMPGTGFDLYGPWGPECDPPMHQPIPQCHWEACPVTIIQGSVSSNKRKGLLVAEQQLIKLHSLLNGDSKLHLDLPFSLLWFAIFISLLLFWGCFFFAVSYFNIYIAVSHLEPFVTKRKDNLFPSLVGSF